MVVFRVVRGVQRHFMYRLPEWAAALNMGLFAVTLLKPAKTFSSSASYNVMASIADENTWGVAVGLVSAVRLIALLLNGTFPVFARYSPLTRSVCAFLSAAAWCALAVSFYRANTAGTAWGNYAVWMTLDWVMAVHVAGEAGPAWRGSKTDGSAS
jgi:hypothetical protein